MSITKEKNCRSY